MATLSICIASIALDRAVGWYGRPFAGLLLTSDGCVSSIGMPSWSSIEQGLRFPNRIEFVDGISLLGPRGGFRAEVWDRHIEAASAQGRPSVHVQVATRSGEREVDLRLERLDPPSWWLYAGTNIFVGGLYALAGVLALLSSPHGQLSRAFSKFALVTALFFLTFFDAHTTRSLVLLFHATYAAVPFAMTGLALRLPDDAPLVVRHPWLLRALDVAALLLVAAVVARDLEGTCVTALQTVCTLLLGGALILFVVTLGLRYLRASGTRRETLGVLFRATATPYAVVGAGVLVAMLSSRGSSAAFLALPAAALAPIATGIAFVRHDLWGSRALLSRVLTRSVAGAVACVFAVGVGAAIAVALGAPFRGALLGAAAGALASAALVNFVTRSVERSLFPAVAEYKPTIEQLSEELTSITDPKQVTLAVERTVRRWLPCERVHFRAGAERQDGAARADQGNGVDNDELSIPVMFGGRTLGSILVGRKRGGALFTTDDLDLLRTIANQAALALAHAHSYAELEQRRQQQAAAWQIERGALVETVAAEIAHEVRYPINFFRSVFRRGPENAKLDAEEIDIGCEEVERLERLVSGLRRMVAYRIERRVVPLHDLVARAEVLLRDGLGDRQLEVRVPRDASLRCDPDQVTQVLVNLVSNAIDATGARGRIGVEWSADDRGAQIVVWDDGVGFDTDAARLFAPWFTTKTRGTGLGLAITQRIVRAHGWSVDASRAGGQTRFTLTLPASDVAAGARRDDALEPNALRIGGAGKPS